MNNDALDTVLGLIDGEILRMEDALSQCEKDLGRSCAAGCDEVARSETADEARKALGECRRDVERMVAALDFLRDRCEALRDRCSQTASLLERADRDTSSGGPFSDSPSSISPLA
ncbi:hypothetical protein CHL67_02095 [Prosthecochloris sp. GSB1]|uniref:hypothetical protein n=1 Tax=Prosthecochloris sp. GSB1 TaxID=281093 RepID=UPI000B8CB8D7|nr:hypothetical protein [Prosthecochloris sp. GSB1]ASQ89871.1 hypothetical protein CHL67_02095 [Prosthecochloris sp. GSB1]